MKHLSYWLLGSLLLLASLGYAQAQQGGTKTFILLRHAEKMSEPGPDPDLSPQGQQRAQALAQLLQEQPITGIYSTPYKRTQGTAKPLAEQKGVAIQTYQPAEGVAMLNKLKAGAGDETFVVLGHSNSTPALVNALLGREEVKTIAEDNYGLVFVVSLLPDGKSNLLTLRLPQPAVAK